MSAQHFIGIGQNARGNAIALFTPIGDGFSALDHHTAVVSAARKGPILPAVFGSQTGADSTQLAIRMARCSKALEDAVAASAGLIEMGVRVTSIDSLKEQTKEKRSGRSFLQTAARKARAAAAFVESVAGLQKKISTLVGVRSVRFLSTHSRIVKMALSVERQHAVNIAAQIENLASSVIEIDISGPWPLYSFGVDHVLGEEVGS